MFFLSWNHLLLFHNLCFMFYLAAKKVTTDLHCCLSGLNRLTWLRWTPTGIFLIPSLYLSHTFFYSFSLTLHSLLYYSFSLSLSFILSNSQSLSSLYISLSIHTAIISSLLFLITLSPRTLLPCSLSVLILTHSSSLLYLFFSLQLSFFTLWENIHSSSLKWQKAYNGCVRTLSHLVLCPEFVPSFCDNWTSCELPWRSLQLCLQLSTS